MALGALDLASRAHDGHVGGKGPVAPQQRRRRGSGGMRILLTRNLYVGTLTRDWEKGGKTDLYEMKKERF